MRKKKQQAMFLVNLLIEETGLDRENLAHRVNNVEDMLLHIVNVTGESLST